MTDLILLATLALIVWATFYFGDIYDAQVALKHKASRDAITPELIDALIDAIYVERSHQAHRSLLSIIEDREDLLAVLDDGQQRGPRGDPRRCRLDPVRAWRVPWLLHRHQRGGLLSTRARHRSRL